MERLGQADVVVLRMRQRMVAAVRRFMETGELAEVDPSIPLGRSRGDGAIIPADAPWESVAAYAGEFTPVLS